MTGRGLVDVAEGRNLLTVTTDRGKWRSIIAYIQKALDTLNERILGFSNGGEVFSDINCSDRTVLRANSEK